MDNNFKFKTRHVSIAQRSSSVVNSFVSSVELIQAMTYRLKRDTNHSGLCFLLRKQTCELNFTADYPSVEQHTG